MSKVLLKSVQDKRCLKEILCGTYKPKFDLSCGAFDDVCGKSYKYMLDELSKKTGVGYKYGEDTCIWSWYQNPYFKNHVNFKNMGVDLVVITFEIDEEDVVFSDFDLWCERLVDGWGIDTQLELGNIDSSRCVQAVSWGIPSGSILSIEPFMCYLNRELKAV